MGVLSYFSLINLCLALLKKIKERKKKTSKEVTSPKKQHGYKALPESAWALGSAPPHYKKGGVKENKQTNKGERILTSIDLQGSSGIKAGNLWGDFSFNGMFTQGLSPFF